MSTSDSKADNDIDICKKLWGEKKDYTKKVGQRKTNFNDFFSYNVVLYKWKK